MICPRCGDQCQIMLRPMRDGKRFDCCKDCYDRLTAKPVPPNALAVEVFWLLVAIIVGIVASFAAAEIWF